MTDFNALGAVSEQASDLRSLIVGLQPRCSRLLPSSGSSRRRKSNLITNPFNADGSGLATTAGNSVAQQIAAVAPEGAHVVKALNSIFVQVIAQDKPLDAFLAGDGAEVKSRVAAFLDSVDMRPLDAGGLEMTYALEWAGMLLVGLARNGAGFDLALAAEVQ